MKPRGLDHLRQMHQMCMEELEILQQNIVAYCRSSAQMQKQLAAHLPDDDCDASIYSSAAVPLIAYDHFLTNLSHVMELTRKFNLHLRFNKLDERLFREGNAEPSNRNNNNNNCQTLALPNGFKKDLNRTQTPEDAELLEQFLVNGRRTLAPPPGFQCLKDAENNEQSQPIMDIKKEAAVTSAACQDNKETALENSSLGQLEETPKVEVTTPNETPPPSAAAASSSVHNANGYDFGTHSIPPIEECNDSALSDAQISPSPFHYTAKELSTYQPGCVLDASITFVQDARLLRFFICDAQSTDMAGVLELQHMVHLRQYSSLPPPNEVFGLVLDGVILRAVRANQSEATTAAYPALLLDFGEVVEVSADADVMYHLPAALQQTPAQAMLCELHGGDDDYPNHKDADALQTQLEQLEYQRVNFRVQAVVERVLHVQLIIEAGDNDAANKNVNQQPAKSLLANSNTNPFMKSAVSNEEEEELTLHEDIASSDPTEQIVPLQPISRDPFDTAAAGAALNGLTPDDWEMLYDEPLATTNAMTAVMGYDPKDDLRICRFYDHAIGACFKGANCKQEHIISQPDGWTKDVLPAATIVDTRTPTMRYDAGHIISITPTYVGQLERFYAQIDDPKSPQTPLIWNPEDVPDWKRLHKPPLTFELVLARYDDEMWYRAKIIESDEQGKMFRVFYVDYGNHQVVPLRDLARCDYAIAQLPFQAVLVRLANVRDEPKATPELRKLGISTLCKMILNQTFDVKVLGHHEDLLVRFVEERFVNLPRILIEMGCVRPFKPLPT